MYLVLNRSSVVKLRFENYEVPKRHLDRARLIWVSNCFNYGVMSSRITYYAVNYRIYNYRFRDDAVDPRSTNPAVGSRQDSSDIYSDLRNIPNEGGLLGCLVATTRRAALNPAEGFRPHCDQAANDYLKVAPDVMFCRQGGIHHESVQKGGESH
jgi:hypothetical protein